MGTWLLTGEKGQRTDGITAGRTQRLHLREAEVDRTVPATQPERYGGGRAAPLRAVVPGTIVGVVIIAAFGAWGMFKPVAPQKWDTPYENVIIASKSTTRYVVLKTDGKTQLHPVLNMASAKLLLDPDKGKVINVDESVLDNGKIAHGATLGIPYAPDRLPDKDEAGSKKRWAVCEQPGEGGRAIQKAAFVFAERDQKKTEGANRLHGGELMYVEGPGPDRTRYIVDATGKAYKVKKDELLLRALLDERRTPSGSPPHGWPPCTPGTRSTSRPSPGRPAPTRASGGSCRPRRTRWA